MITIYPFRALMPKPDRAHLVAAVPYDVVTAEEAAKLAENNAVSFLRVSRAEIELPADTDPYSDAVYLRAVQNFIRLRDEAPLEFDLQESLYVYSLEMDGRRQNGIAAAVSVDDYDEERIKKHELTRKDKEDDRTRHILELRSHTGPVFLARNNNADIDAVVRETMASKPLLRVVRDPGPVIHEVWRVPPASCERLKRAFEKMPTLYIADGHHRAKSASRTREVCRQRNSGHTGNEAYNRFLAVIFPANELLILPYNRYVTDLNGQTKEQFLAAVRGQFEVAPTTQTNPPHSGIVHIYLDRQWYSLRPRDGEQAEAATDRLDVSVLQKRLLAPILGIQDPRTDKRIAFAGGSRSVETMTAAVDSGTAAVAFSMYPVTTDQLMAVSDQGLIMPPKSTWFEPKLLDGLLCHCF